MAQPPSSTPTHAPESGGGGEPHVTFDKAMAEMQAKQQANAATLGIGHTDRWDADLEKGTIVFSGHNDRMMVTALLQVVGTYLRDDKAWLWGWDHPTVPAALAKSAQLCRAFGERYHLAQYTQRKIVCEETDAWQFTAVALYLSKATGAYRGPSGSTLVFMTFADVTLSKEP